MSLVVDSTPDIRLFVDHVDNPHNPISMGTLNRDPLLSVLQALETSFCEETLSNTSTTYQEIETTIVSKFIL